MHAMPSMFVAVKTAPMTAAERSRRFRERHPTYHMEWKRRRRASLDASAVATPPAIATPLMLPAPQPPAFDLLAQLAALRQRQAELELVLANAAP